MDLSKSILIALAIVGKTRLWLANEIGTYPSYISDLTRGKRTCTMKRAQQIADACGMKLSEFIKLGEES